MSNNFFSSFYQKLGRRFADSMRDASAFVDEINRVRTNITRWRKRVNSLDERDINKIQEAIDSLRREIRALSTEMEVGEGKLDEAEAIGATIVNRTATGAHLLHEGNRQLIMSTDVDGMAEYLTVIEMNAFKRAFDKVPREKQAEIIQAVIK